MFLQWAYQVQCWGLEVKMSKRIIITGSEGLLGKEISRYLESTGHSVIGCDLQLGHDLTDEEFVKDFFKKNKADCLANLYAINPHVNSEDYSTNMFDITLDSLNSYLQVNLLSLFSVCREYARNNKNGSIINFSSTYGIVSPNPALYEEGKEKHIGYCVSKSGVIQLTRYLAVHLAPNIRVNCVAPGGVTFEPTNEHSKKFIEQYREKTPMKRMMNVDELNGIIEYLCSDKSSYATGTTFHIDGGWTIW